MKLNKSLTLICFASLIFCTLTANASSPANGFKVALVKDAIGSEHIISGKYNTGIDELNLTNNKDDFDKQMGLCVAHIKTLKLEAAEKSCSSAIKTISSNAARSRHDKLLKALAYSNRGVVHYLDNKTNKAYQDFVKASKLTTSNIVNENLAYFKAKAAPYKHSEEPINVAED